MLRNLERVVTRPDPAAWRALALAVTFAATDLIIADRRAASLVAAIWRCSAPASRRGDAMVTGRIGGRDLSEGCFSFSRRRGRWRLMTLCGPAAPGWLPTCCAPASPSGRYSESSMV